MTLQKLQDASCSDGDCVFKITPEMKKGMRTNGGCSCLKDMRHGIGSRKTYAVMVLSQIASDAEAALKEKDARIKELEYRLNALDSFEKMSCVIQEQAKEIMRLREALEHYTCLIPWACDEKCWCAKPWATQTAKEALEARDE